MSPGELCYEAYHWRGRPELILSNVTKDDAQIVVIPPLFEEANYSRRLLADVLRGLGARGIGAILPDLPGTGESLCDLETVAFDDWRDAIALLAAGRHVAALRGGALLDGHAGSLSHWRLAPLSGAEVLRGLKRLDAFSGGREEGALAGYPLDSGFRQALAAAALADPTPLRLFPMPPGIAPWRRAEPAADATLAAQIVDDLADWMDRCAAR